MTEKTYKKAGELLEKIRKLENFMFWCSGKREGARKYKWVIVKLKRKWCGGVREEEFELTERLKEKICQCVEEEIKKKKKELDELH